MKKGSELTEVMCVIQEKHEAKNNNTRLYTKLKHLVEVLCH